VIEDGEVRPEGCLLYANHVWIYYVRRNAHYGRNILRTKTN